MKVLILGSGAREHAIAWKFAQSNRIAGLHIAPGNAGTAQHGENLPNLDPMDFNGVIEICREREINLVFVGPEDPLAGGVVDAISGAGIAAIGPGADAARLESSKAFSKAFMKRHRIPTAVAHEFDNPKTFEKHIGRRKKRFVLKKSGLAAGKGVLESEVLSELIAFGRSVLEKDKLLVEDYLTGWEVSAFALLDGRDYKLLPFCADFKKSMEQDQGLNTGGMGAICPVPLVSDDLKNQIIKQIIEPTFKGMKKENLMYRGVLFFGIIITQTGPQLLEYNVRFGDPESQVLIPLIDSDFGNLCDAIVHGTLDQFPIQLSTNSAVGVVVASRGYPGPYSKGVTVKSLPPASAKGQLVFHASTTKNDSGEIVTGGGRCFTVVGIGPNTLSAHNGAYKAVPGVVFDGAWYRSDIGKKFFLNE